MSSWASCGHCVSSGSFRWPKTVILRLSDWILQAYTSGYSLAFKAGCLLWPCEESLLLRGTDSKHLAWPQCPPVSNTLIPCFSLVSLSFNVGSEFFYCCFDTWSPVVQVGLGWCGTAPLSPCFHLWGCWGRQSCVLPALYFRQGLESNPGPPVCHAGPLPMELHGWLPSSLIWACRLLLLW